MASVATLLQELDEKDTILDLVYSSFDTDELQGLSTRQLQNLYVDLRHATLNIPQIEASISYTCACPGLCDREELLDVLNEMDRRYYLAKDLQWEFALLDHQRKGAITQADALFLFQMVYGVFFSKYKFERLIQSRKVPGSDVSFEEIEVPLCNIPTHDWMEELFNEEDREKEEQEFKRREAERKRKESEELKQREAEMKEQLEEEDKKMRALLAKRKLEEEEEKRSAEAENINREIREKKEEEERKALDEKNKFQTEKEAKEKAQHEKENQLKAEKEKNEENERKKAEEDRLQAEAEQRISEEKHHAEIAELERLKAEQDELEQLKNAEKAEEDRINAENAEKERVHAEIKDVVTKELEAQKLHEERALQNWKMAEKVVKRKLREKRLKNVYAAKAKRDEEEGLKEEEDAGLAEEAENKAEEEFERAELLLQNATNDDERNQAEETKAKARKEALKHRERRLRGTLKAAVKIRFRPKIDVAIIEAIESEIPALKPDIEVAEKASDSIKCGEDLENAMVKRDLPEIETAIETIKAKGYEKEHTVQISDAEKLLEKLKRLEKLKKEILALDQRTISEIRSYKTPIPAIHEVMIATYIILGYKEKELKQWKFIQALLGRSGKEGLKRMCTTLEASKIDMRAAGIAEKKYLSKHDLVTITDVSAGAATFYVWCTAMIEEATSWLENAEFRKKIEEKRKQEEEEVKKLQENKRPVNKFEKPKGVTAAATSKQAIEKKEAKKGPASDVSSRSRSPAPGSPAVGKKNLKSEAKSTPSRNNLSTTPRSRSKSPVKSKK